MKTNKETVPPNAGGNNATTLDLLGNSGNATSGGAASASPVSDDAFDLGRLRLSQDFSGMVGVRKALVTVPVRKPSRQEFIRVHPDAGYRIDTAVLELKEERETYLVDPNLRADLPEVVAKTLFTVINRQGVVFLWPVRLPGRDGRLDEWNRSAFEAAQIAMKAWVRVAANMSLGAYDILIATGELPPPEWPDASFQTLLHTAFRDRFIQSADHVLVRRLRGEV